jgi:hypothetical protein
MKKEFSAYGVILVLALVLAWWASLPQSTKDASRQAVLSIDSSRITTLKYTSEELSYVASKGAQGQWWVETEKAGVKERFLAAKKLTELLEQFSPLEAIRTVGVVKDENREEYGLKDSKKKIILLDGTGGEVLTLQLGKQAYGSRNVFTLESIKNQVVLLGGELIGDLERPDLKLYERSITNVIFEELKSATLKYKSKSRQFIRQKRDDKGVLLWTRDSADGAVVQPAKSWFDRIDRVRVVSYISDVELSALEKAEPVFELELVATSAAQDKLVVKKLPFKDEKSPAGEYFVFSEFLKTWAKVGATRMEPIEKDLASVVGDE